MTRAPALLTGTAFNIAGRVLTLALGLALLVVVARKGPEMQGAFALFVAVESLLVAAGSGLGLALAREVVQGQVARARLRARLGAAVGVGAVAGVLLALASRWLPAPGYSGLWLLAIAAPFALLAPTVQGLWLGQGRLLAMNLGQAAAPALVLVLLGLLALLQAPAAMGATGVLAAWALGRVLVGLACATVALRASAVASAQFLNRSPDRAHARDVASPVPPVPAAPGGQAAASASQAGPATAATPGTAHAPGLGFLAAVAVSNVISLLNLRATLFLVERQSGLAEAGVYSVAVQLAELLWVLSAAVSMSAYHALRGGADGGAMLALRMVRIGVGLAALAAPLLGAAVWWGLPLVLGPGYAAARLPLLVLLPGVVAYAAASGLSAYYTQGRGQPQWSARVAGISLVLTLALAAWTVPRWGALGAAMATSLAYALTMAWALPAFLRDQGWGWAQLLGAAAPRQSAP